MQVYHTQKHTFRENGTRLFFGNHFWSIQRIWKVSSFIPNFVIIYAKKDTKFFGLSIEKKEKTCKTSVWDIVENTIINFYMRKQALWMLNVSSRHRRSWEKEKWRGGKEQDLSRKCSAWKVFCLENRVKFGAHSREGCGDQFLNLR